MWNRYIYIDDAFFGEQAYWLANDGIVKTVTLTDFLNTDIHLMSYHKLHIWIGALIIKLMGWSVTPLRSATLIIYAAFLWLFVGFSKKVTINYHTPYIYIALFLLIVNPLIVLYAFTFRPEIWVMTFGFASYIFLDRILRNDNNRTSETLTIALSGLFAGLAMLTHLNGLIFPVAGFIVLLINRKWKHLLLFTIFSILAVSLYFIDLWQDGNFSLWIYQLKNWPDNNATNYLSGGFAELLKNVLFKLSQEHMRFFWSSDVWGISSFFIVSLIFSFRHLWKTQKNLIIYFLSLVLTLNIAGSQIAERFLIYLFPYMVIIIAFAIVSVKTRTILLPKILFIILFALQIVTVVISFQDIFKRNSPHVEISEQIMQHIPENQLTLVPYNMIFNSLEGHQLTSFKGFEYYEVYENNKLTQTDVFNRAKEMGIQYIVIPKKEFKNTETSLDCLDNKPLKETQSYSTSYEDSRCIILKSD